MTQEEKTKKHLQRQNKRTRSLLWKTVSPLMLMLVLSVPLFLSAFYTAKYEPGISFKVNYSDFYRRWTKGRLYILDTESDGSFRLPWQILENGFRDDIHNGTIRPGEILTITTRTGIYEDWIATLSTENRCYGDSELYQEIKNDWIRNRCIAGGIFLAVGLTISGIFYFVYYDAFRQVGRLRKKYRAKLKSEQSGDY